MLAATEAAPLAPDELEAALLDAVAPYRFEDTRFCAILAADNVPKAAIRHLARGTVAGANGFVALLARMVEAAPDPASRLLLLENLLAEEGILFSPSRGIQVKPQLRHANVARRLALASGMSEGEIDAIGPEAEPANFAHARRLLCEDRWLEAVAYLLIGAELKTGLSCPLIVDLLRRAGLSRQDVAFYEMHSEADLAHGRQAFDMVLRNASTRCLQDVAIKAAADGARDWFQTYGGLAKTKRMHIA